MPTTKINTTPVPGTIIGPIYEYTNDQKKMMEELKEYALSLLLPPTDPYHPWEKRWINQPDTIPRYMRAAKWKINDGKKRIKGTLEWRREFKPELITPEEIKIEDEGGKIVINGFDKDGRPIIYMRPGRQNTETSPRQLRHLVWCLERAKDLMPPSQQSLVIIVDYKTTTLRTNPSISVASKVLTILQQHYVETLGRAIVTNLPMLLSFFYKGISPFLDPVTRDKMRFNPNLLELIPASQLEAEFGGEYDFEFVHEDYWKQIIETCAIEPDGTRVRGRGLNPPEVEAEKEAKEKAGSEGKEGRETEAATTETSPSSTSAALSEKFAEVTISSPPQSQLQVASA